MMRTIHRLEVVAIRIRHECCCESRCDIVVTYLSQPFLVIWCLSFHRVAQKRKHCCWRRDAFETLWCKADCFGEFFGLCPACRAILRNPKLHFAFGLYLHRREHRLRIVGEVTALFVEAIPSDVWRADTLITGGELSFLRKFLQFFSDYCAAREKHWEAWAYVVIENE